MAVRCNFLTRTSLALPLAFGLVGLLGCQNVTEKDWAAFCQNNEWAKHGYFDATNGFSIQLLSVYKNRCGDNLSSKDAKVYQRGFLKGIKEFCTFEKGYELGREGESKPDTCPPELAKQFNAGFQNGLGEYWKEEGLKRALEEKQEAMETQQSEIGRRQSTGSGRSQ
ncbi:DUF2799 domain-containing protein [Marinimicrobium agarilyticum]|uniref:DUF2799 domain-containing protein n=1 Tax=Marinimicrobium agarilyticum TaxID=306546 RepID=UPI000421B7D9|nr:DUF2799 domain-containing protein [Marinimicrobium agarilyticum]